MKVLLSKYNCKVLCAAISLCMILTITGCGKFSNMFAKKPDPELEVKEIRLSTDILNMVGLTERWIIKSLGGRNTEIKNIDKHGDNLFIFNSDSTFYCISMVTGGVKWEKRLPQKYGNIAQVSFYRDRVLLALSNQVYEYNMSTGFETNHWEMSFTPTTSVARTEDLLFTGATDDRFYCLKLPLLTCAWKSLQSQQANGDIWLDTEVNSRGEKVGNVYFTCDNGTMYAAKYNERKLLWSLETSGDVPGSLYDDGQCFLPSTDTALYCIDSASGQIFWKYLAGGKLYEVPCVTGEFVYQPILGKSLVCMKRFPGGKKPSDGVSRLQPEVIWELKQGSKFLCEAGERVFAMNDLGQMVIMNNRTGNKEYSLYLPNIDEYYSNIEDDLLILANKQGDIMVLQQGQ